MFFGDRIKAWATRKMYDKMEDALRAQMGMPSRKEEKKRRKQQQSRQDNNNNHTTSRNSDEPLIPKEYAEDVEFTEYKEYSSSTTITEETSKDGRTKKVTIESQVEDAEFVEIRD